MTHSKKLTEMIKRENRFTLARIFHTDREEETAKLDAKNTCGLETTKALTWWRRGELNPCVRD
ncbi:MAG: hypothetical protein QE493_01985 [Verrucomicrobiae bacterium]|nr:hypothetical protein [Verrucomicrobiae bacterium]